VAMQLKNNEKLKILSRIKPTSNNHLIASFSRQPGTRKVKPFWILIRKEILVFAEGSSISKTICKQFESAL